jgi:hypothetical protein
MPTPRHSLVRLGGILLASSLVIAGCGGTAPASGVPSPAAAEPTNGPAESIDTAAGIKIANATVAALNTKNVVVHIEEIATGTAGSGGQAVKVVVTSSADLAGKDMAFDISAKAAGTSIDQRIRVVGKYVYVYQSGLWSKVKRSKLKKELAELGGLIRFITDPHDLRYLGEERVGKQDLHHFRANRHLPYDSGAGFKGNYDTFDIWVLKDGTPVRIEATFTASSPTIGTVTGTSSIDFTKFGGKIKIKVPKVK